MVSAVFDIMLSALIFKALTIAWGQRGGDKVNPVFHGGRIL